MRILSLVLLFAYYGVSEISTQGNLEANNTSSYEGRICDEKLDITYEYRTATYDVAILTFKAVALRSTDFNFVFSPSSIWIMLAAVAEGTDPDVQEKLFEILNLSKDPCIRHSFYQLATTRAFPTSDVIIRSNRIMLIDDSLTLNPSWYNIILKNNLLDVITAPIKYNPVATSNEIKRIMSAQLPRLNLTGNSVLLDSMDYSGLWTTAFADAAIERSPFYNQAGDKIGYVDLMRVKRRARMAYLKKINSKVLELPIGLDGRYRMLFSITLANNDIQPIIGSVSKDLIFEVFENLRESYVQLDIAIPRMEITSEIDVRTLLEDLGVKEIWTDPAATRFISDPPAFPSSFNQRATIVLNNEGLAPPSQEGEPLQSLKTGLEPILGREFIANRPFLFALFDVETHTCLLGTAYSTPTYPL